MVKVSGNTYPHRTTIKQAGFRWDPSNKIWFAVHASPSMIEAVSDLNGVIVTQNGEQVGGRQPTHKELYGRCEDAPCCGCCGGPFESIDWDNFR